MSATILHPDDIAVDRFAAAMKAKLAQKRAEGRGGWEDKSGCSNEFLSDMLRSHVRKGDPVDVANFAMMIHQRGETIASLVSPPGTGTTDEPTKNMATRGDAVAWMAFDERGACELFLDEGNADGWRGSGGYKVALVPGPELTRPINLDVAGAAKFVAKVQADALRGIAAEVVEELSKRPQTKWGEIIAGLREAADRLEAQGVEAPVCRECNGRGWVDDLEEYAKTGRKMRTWCHLCGGDIVPGEPCDECDGHGVGP